MTTITTRSLQSAQPKPTPYFIRDDKVKGFAAKVNPSGSIKLIAEVRHEGRTVRKTNCPGTNHSLQLQASNNLFFCGYCNRSGGIDDFKTFVEERKNGVTYLNQNR